MNQDYQLFNKEAEECVIASVLINPSRIVEVQEILSEEDFFIYQNKLIYRAMIELDAMRQPIDPMLVIQKLTAMEVLNEAGGLAYIMEIAHNVPVSNNTLAYCRFVKDKSRERELLGIAQAMRDEIVNGDADTDTKINNALALPLAIDHGDKHERETVHFLKEALKDLTDRHEADGKITGLKTHYRELDARFHGLQPGQLMILAGRPASGKTSLALNFAINTLFDDKKGAVLFFSLEMTGKELADKMVCAIGKADYKLYKMGFPKNLPETEGEWEKVNYGFTKLKSATNLVIDDRAGITFQQLRSKAIRTKRKYGTIKALFVDYLTLIRTPGKDSRVLEVGALSRGLKGLAKELECPVICLAQLSRKVEERADKRPTMHDLRDSGEIEQDADIISMIYRDEVYNEESERKGIAEIITVKNRAGEIGADFLQADLKRSRFNNLDIGFEPPKQQQTKSRRF